MPAVPTLHYICNVVDSLRLPEASSSFPLACTTENDVERASIELHSIPLRYRGSERVFRHIFQFISGGRGY